MDYRWAENEDGSASRTGGRTSSSSGQCNSFDRRYPFGVCRQGRDHDDPCRLHHKRRPGQTWSCHELARPGGNLTGINFFTAELTAKRLELLRELVPAATRVAILVNPANSVNTEATLREGEPAARAIGLPIRVLNASTIREINAAFATFSGERPDALFVGIDPFFNSRRINWSTWRHAMRSRRHFRRGTLQKLAGL